MIPSSPTLASGEHQSEGPKWVHGSKGAANQRPLFRWRQWLSDQWLARLVLCFDRHESRRREEARHARTHAPPRRAPSRVAQEVRRCARRRERKLMIDCAWRKERKRLRVFAMEEDNRERGRGGSIVKEENWSRRRGKVAVSSVLKEERGILREAV